MFTAEKGLRLTYIVLASAALMSPLYGAAEQAADQHGDRKPSQQRPVCRGDISPEAGDLH
jgi:hypothetical protein